MLVLVFAMILVGIGRPSTGQGQVADPSALCDHAAVLAAAETGVPISVLKAIALTETGRERNGNPRPWPWTVNMEGNGVWFETGDVLKAYVDEHFKRGARSFDVGCFQINYKWHHQNFSSLSAMFDPNENALYAARFLLDLHAEKGSWEAAAGAYHSRTPEYAERYMARFASFRARFIHEDDKPLRVVAVESVDPSPAMPRQTSLRVNTYPLLQTGDARGLGSLVPLSPARSGASLFTRGEAG